MPRLARFGDCFSVVEVVLVGLQIGLNKLCRDDPDNVSGALESPPPELRAWTRLDSDNARCQGRNKLGELAAAELLPVDRFATFIHGDNVEPVLAKVDADNVDLLLSHGGALLWKIQVCDDEEGQTIPLSRHVLREEPEVKYVFMAAHTAEFKVRTMSRALEASRSGFYAWLQRLNKSSAQAQRREHLDEVVKAAFVAAKGRSGSPRLTLDLADAGEVFDRKTVANGQRRQRLRAKAAKKFKATTNSDHSLPVAPNLLNQDFTATAPCRKWVTLSRRWTESPPYTDIYKDNLIPAGKFPAAFGVLQ